MKTEKQGSPKTLLQLAGASDQIIDWNDAALVLIDIQLEYVKGLLSLGPAGTSAIDRSARLLEVARAHGIPVVHVVHHESPGGAIFDPESDNAQIVPQLTPLPEETVVTKGLPNAFAGTNLTDVLRTLGRGQLIVAGFMSHMCVSSTVRAALDLDFRTIVCSDACATRTLPAGDEVMPADVVHAAAMAALSDRFATILTLDDIVRPAA